MCVRVPPNQIAAGRSRSARADSTTLRPRRPRGSVGRAVRPQSFPRRPARGGRSARPDRVGNAAGRNRGSVGRRRLDTFQLRTAFPGSKCRNSDFRRCSSPDFFIGLHGAPLHGILLCFRRGNTSGSRDLISATSCLFGPAESTSRAHLATVLETEARRRQSPGACCTQWLRCLQDKADHV